MRYVATLRAIFDADSDIHAQIIAEHIRENGAEDLDDDDVLDVTQVTCNQLEIQPEEVISQLKRARNLLIKTRIKECFQLAREFDQVIYALRFRDNPDFSMSGYSHGDFMDLVDAIITRGEEPDV